MTAVPKTAEAWILKKRPDPKLAPACFEKQEVEVPEPKDGEITVKPLWFSVDPYMRARVNAGKNYFEAFELGKPLESGCVAEVVVSKNDKFPVGTKLQALLKWIPYQTLDPARAYPVQDNVPLSWYLGILGLTGLSAWLPMKHFAQEHLKPGKTCFVSGAAGAVGSAVIGLCKIHGMKVVGSAGTDEKVAYTKSLGIDACFNYKTEQNYSQWLAKECPDGIDLYFDNVGGPMLEAALENMALNGLIIACGSISNYDRNRADVAGVKNWFFITTKRLTVRGFIVSDWLSEFPAGAAELGKWVQEGKLRSEETVREGFNSLPDAFIGLFQGENTGKMVVKM
eukprot:Clim_evm59s142 gene=Clim_evmTU59s142